MASNRLKVQIGCARSVLAFFAGAALVILTVAFVVFVLFGLLMYG